MQTLETKFQRELERLVEERIAHISDLIANGSLEDIQSYKRETGRIAGLRESLALMDDARKNLQER